MPGGRGTILDVSNSLANEPQDHIAEAIKQAIDSGYRISDTSIPMLGAAYATCASPEYLTDVWCHALSKGAVDWADY